MRLEKLLLGATAIRDGSLQHRAQLSSCETWSGTNILQEGLACLQGLSKLPEMCPELGNDWI
jgi:hypothetical protein